MFKPHSHIRAELCRLLDILHIYNQTREIIDLIIHQNSIVRTKTHHGQHCWGVGSSHHIKSVSVDCSCINFICLFPLPCHMSLISHIVKKSTKAIPNLANNWKSSSLKQVPIPIIYKLSKTYGDIMELNLGSICTLAISSAKLAQEVFKTHYLVFASSKLHCFTFP